MATPNKFSKGDKVIVTRRNGAKVIGTIARCNKVSSSRLYQ